MIRSDLGRTNLNPAKGSQHEFSTGRGEVKGLAGILAGDEHDLLLMGHRLLSHQAGKPKTLQKA